MPHFHDTQGQFLDAEVDALQSPHIKNYAKSDALASLIEELKLSYSEGEDAQKNEQAKLDIITIASEISADY